MTEVSLTRSQFGRRPSAYGYGRRGGRPPALDEAKIRAANAMLASGETSAVEVAQQLGLHPSTLYQHLPGGRSGIEQVGQLAA
nr:helix-turn-helix domain-containing protein [uncultured Rhodopila sp.]